MKHFKLLLFAFTLLFSISAIAAPTSDKAPKAKKEHKTTAEKKVNKKFTTYTFYYIGTNFPSDLGNASSWTTTPQSCPTGTAKVCSITFSDTGSEGYGVNLDGSPNSAVLSAVTAHYNDSPTSVSFTAVNINFVRRS